MLGQYKGTLAQRFAWAASALAGASLLLTMLAALWLSNRQQLQANQVLMQKEAVHNVRLLNTALSAITSRLNDAVNSSLLANALVDSSGRQNYLTPFLNGMQAINGIPVKLLFTDFEGAEISSSGGAHFSAQQVAWLQKQLASGKSDVAIFPGPQGDELVIVELMMYSRTKSAEGALMYKVALSDLQALVSARLLWGDAKAEEANGIGLPLQVLPRMQGLKLRILQMPLPTQTAENGALPTYLLIVFIALLLAAIVLFVGLRLAPGLTRDLRELELFSRSVVENGFGEQRANIDGSIEVVSLANSINHMLDRLHEQHAKLQADSDARYRLLVEGTNAISWEAALPDFRYLYVSPQGQALTEIDCNAWLLSGFWLAHLHPDDRVEILSKRAQSIAAKLDYHCEYRFLRADGSYVWLEEVAAVLLDEHGEAYRLRGILLDVDERKLVENRLAQERAEVDRLKNDFVSTVSHELRTPLTSIRGSLGLVLGGVSGPIAASTEKLLRIAHQNSERLVSLINDLLDIDKIVSGKMEFEWQWLELLPLLEQAIESNQAYANNLGVNLVLLPCDVHVSVKIDVNRLMQVLANLLSNAAKFSPRGAAVEVRVTRRREVVRVSVIDHGNGISAEFREKIFQKFSQEDSSSTRGKGGTGLGLAISKVLIEQMGGVIGFDSIQGQGTTFYFELPL